MELGKPSPALWTQTQNLKLQPCFFPACVLIEVCSHSLNFSSIFLHSSFAFHFVQKPQQDTILVLPTRARLIEGKAIKLPFYLLLSFFLTKEEEAGGNDCGCQEGSGYWGRRALSPQPFSKSVFSGLLTQIVKSLRAAGLDPAVTLNTSHRLNGKKKPTQGNLKIRPNAAHPLNRAIGTTPVSPTQKRFSPDLLWYLLILVAPSAASLGLRGLGELQKLIPVFSSACPLWQLQ